jgi:hypothetical protein
MTDYSEHIINMRRMIKSMEESLLRKDFDTAMNYSILIINESILAKMSIRDQKTLEINRLHKLEMNRLEESRL